MAAPWPRRAERASWRCGALDTVNAAPRQYLNRLSDLLFVLARAQRANLDGLGGDDVYGAARAWSAISGADPRARGSQPRRACTASLKVCSTPIESSQPMQASVMLLP